MLYKSTLSAKFLIISGVAKADRENRPHCHKSRQGEPSPLSQRPGGSLHQLVLVVLTAVQDGRNLGEGNDAVFKLRAGTGKFL